MSGPESEGRLAGSAERCPAGLTGARAARPIQAATGPGFRRVTLLTSRFLPHAQFLKKLGESLLSHFA